MSRSSRPPPSSFSFVLKVGNPGDEWTLALRDLDPLPMRRGIRLDVPRGPVPQPANAPPATTTARPFAGRLDYEAVYFDAEVAQEKADGDGDPPRHSTSPNGSFPHPGPSGPQEFARITRSRGLDSERPDSLFRKALEVLLSMWRGMGAMWRRVQRLVAKTLAKVF